MPGVAGDCICDFEIAKVQGNPTRVNGAMEIPQCKQYVALHQGT
jgi:hypothetical protein